MTITHIKLKKGKGGYYLTFHTRNNKTVFDSSKDPNKKKSYAMRKANDFAAQLGCKVIDETKS